CTQYTAAVGGAAGSARFAILAEDGKFRWELNDGGVPVGRAANPTATAALALMAAALLKAGTSELRTEVHPTHPSGFVWSLLSGDEPVATATDALPTRDECSAAAGRFKDLARDAVIPEPPTGPVAAFTVAVVPGSDSLSF